MATRWPTGEGSPPALTPARRSPRGEGTVQRRTSDGRWYAAIPLPPDGTGKRRRAYAYCPADNNTEREAHRLRRELLTARDAGKLPADRQTLGQWLAIWLAQCVEPGGDTNTIDIRRRDVARWTAALGAVRLADLTPGQVQAALTRFGHELSPRSVLMARGTLVTALNQAVRWEIIGRNAAALTRAPRVPNQAPVVLSVDQARAFLAAARSERLTALFTVALAVGLRRGEALGLRWADVDLDSGRLTVAQQVQHEAGKGLVSKAPKSRRPRTIGLPAFAVAALRAHAAGQKRDRLLAGPGWWDSGLVFTTHAGGPVWPATVDDALHRIRDTAGVPGLTMHGLRHSCATLLLAQGVPERVITEILGHSSAALLKVYAHVTPSLIQTAADRLDEALAGSPAVNSAVND